ncbi:NAD(P)-dependent oxidoreductase [Gammaproteobacteria bacterium]|nr:NAD(P)-dependent oxidoreductase [Gammaproteobacteria bacterium]MDG2228509.1 NAD(P)-dependent oxidoreductase [Gammaproteobacteria bacterium]
MEKVVVIGGSGFIGSHTADSLSDAGYKVTIFDNKESEWIREDQEMIVGDILQEDEINEAIRGSKFVYHFAGIADIAESKVNPLQTVKLNVLGTMNAVQASVNSGIKRFVLASTMYVYSPYGSFYRATKQASESIIEVFSDELGLDYSFLRYGSLYGPRSQSWNGLRRYVEQVYKEGVLDYRGTGKERREYIHVLDAAKLSVDILDEKYANTAITVTGHQALYSDELIDLIFEISGKEKNVNYIDSNISPDHYLNTPYRFSPKTAIKLVPDKFYDLGQGVLEVMEEISK